MSEQSGFCPASNKQTHIYIYILDRMYMSLSHLSLLLRSRIIKGLKGWGARCPRPSVCIIIYRCRRRSIRIPGERRGQFHLGNTYKRDDDPRRRLSLLPLSFRQQITLMRTKSKAGKGQGERGGVVHSSFLVPAIYTYKYVICFIYKYRAAKQWIFRAITLIFGSQINAAPRILFTTNCK